MTHGRPRSPAKGWFVTGTDTEVGKTLLAASLLHALAKRGYRCVGMKPVASGCTEVATGLHRSDDAETLLAHSSVTADYADANPYGFVPAVAPHLAARAAGQAISIARIHAHYQRLCANADWVVVEGVGGWSVPLSDDTTVADLARALGLPVLLVVGMRLGCLNHALLSAEAIERYDLVLAGWVANRVEPDMALLKENVDTLSSRLAAPLLGVIPYLRAPAPSTVTTYLDVKRLLAER